MHLCKFLVLPGRKTKMFPLYIVYSCRTQKVATAWLFALSVDRKVIPGGFPSAADLSQKADRRRQKNPFVVDYQSLLPYEIGPNSWSF